MTDIPRGSGHVLGAPGKDCIDCDGHGVFPTPLLNYGESLKRALAGLPHQLLPAGKPCLTCHGTGRDNTQEPTIRSQV